MRLLSISLLVAVTAILLPGVVTSDGDVVAGTALRMDVPDLAERSETILEGRILSAVSLEREGRIETQYLLQVERTFLGEDEPFRTVELPGGVLEDGRGMILAGMPRLRPGENVLLFLSQPGSTGVRMPVGLAQGKFTVRTRADGSKSLIRDAAGMTLVDAQGAFLRGEGRVVLEYADVVARIEAALAPRGR
jgi:hypothetical protein